MSAPRPKAVSSAAARMRISPTKTLATRCWHQRRKHWSASSAGCCPELTPRAEFAWTGSFGQSASGLPTIGRVPDWPNCWVALGYGGNGIAYSRIAADIIAGALTGHPDIDADLYDFRRKRRSALAADRLAQRGALAVMRVPHRDRERVGGVVGRRIGLGQQHAQHQPDLLLLAVTGADDGLLHQVGRVFGDRNPRARRDQQRHAARLAELERRAGVLVDEGGLDRRLVRGELLDHLGEAVVDRHQPLGQREPCRWSRPSRRRRRSAGCPRTSIRPQPVRRSPGSMPRMRIGRPICPVDRPTPAPPPAQTPMSSILAPFAAAPANQGARAGPIRDRSSQQAQLSRSPGRTPLLCRGGGRRAGRLTAASPVSARR